ncbi:MAG: T9SS type A sorting domain-containing protein, partial [Elusimicrobiota bacterium]
FVDGKIMEQTLKPYLLNEEYNLWEKIPRYQVNEDKHTVTASVGHFSVFNIIGSGQASLEDAHAFPVPFKPSDHDKITFTNISTICTIKIYTLKGELLKTIKHEGGGSTSWNDIKAGSGTYIYTIENENDFKKGKLMIIR